MTPYTNLEDLRARCADYGVEAGPAITAVTTMGPPDHYDVTNSGVWMAWRDRGIEALTSKRGTFVGFTDLTEYELGRLGSAAGQHVEKKEHLA